MPKILYIKHKFRADALAMIDQANAIIHVYMNQGYTLTLRQLYYQFVARGLIENTLKSYKKIQGIVNKARLAGLLDWKAIEDRTRNLKKTPHWSSPSHIVDSCVQGYAIDKWATQDYRIEVWIEKDALLGVIEQPCERNQVPYFSCRGYTSASEVWGAAMRMQTYINNNQQGIIIHLGDHDPSGVDMSRDIWDRINNTFRVNVKVERIALTMEQVEEINPPPNPAKTTDSRSAKYIAEFGNESWELDALEPSYLDRIIQETINKYRDADAWGKATAREEKERDELRLVSTYWDDVVSHAQDLDQE